MIHLNIIIDHENKSFIVWQMRDSFKTIEISLHMVGFMITLIKRMLIL